MPPICALRRAMTSAEALNISVDFAARSHHQTMGNAGAIALFLRVRMIRILVAKAGVQAKKRGSGSEWTLPRCE